MRFSDIRMRPKLIVTFLAVGIVPLIIIGVLGAWMASQALMENAFASLTSVRSIKKDQVQRYFHAREGDMKVLQELVANIRSDAYARMSASRDLKLESLKAYFDKLVNDSATIAATNDVEQLYERLVQYHKDTGVTPEGAYDVTTDAYKKIVSDYGAYIRQARETFGAVDIYLACAAHGHIMASVGNKADLGTNLRFGPLKDTPLAKVWDKAIKNKGHAILDFETNPAQGNEPMALIASGVKLGGEVKGVMIIAVSPDKISQITGQRAGLGKSGETYLVGQDHLMRSDSLHDQTGRSVRSAFADPAKGKVETEATTQALAGKSGLDVIVTYDGRTVLSAFAPFQYEDLTWAMVAELNFDEAMVPIDEEGKDFYSKFAREYGYHDLFLAGSDGQCFHSAGKAVELGTNLASGKYARTGLGGLVQKVIQTRKTGFADFAPYEPAQNKIMAFLAAPLIDKRDNEFEMVVALALPYNDINGIMSNREGMGKTGESYLVGTDRRLRSDSFLDGEGHSVKASFAGSVEHNGAATETMAEALRGKSGVRLAVNYLGRSVLSSFDSVSILDGVTWAILAEISEDEVKHPVRDLSAGVIGAAVILAALISLLALLVARQISIPLEKSVLFAKRIANHDLTGRLALDQKDELGDLTTALNAMAGTLTGVVKEIGAGVNTLDTSAGEMAAIAKQMSANAGATADKAATVAAAAKEMDANMNTVAAAMEETTVSMNTVASSSEQMSASIAEIAKNASQAKINTSGAVDLSRKASRQVNELGVAAEEIGAVTETIKAISDKTNLLALNATIEAARAGEAGKGFAVVANEIKDLSQKTAEATDNISKKLKAIQKSAGLTVSEIEEVASAIATVDEVVNSIAAAVEEQNVTTGSMAESITQVSTGIKEINDQIGRTTAASSQVAAEIGGVNLAASEFSQSSARIEGNAVDLAKLAGQLQNVVQLFVVEKKG